METADQKNDVSPPVLALDLGKKRVGVAVSDDLSISISKLDALPRTNWKQLLRDVDDLIQRYDAKTLVIGLPLRLNGTDGDAATETRRLATNFARSLKLPVYLQDERLTSRAAEENLRLGGAAPEDIRDLVDSESAALILRDFLMPSQERTLVTIS